MFVREHGARVSAPSDRKRITEPFAFFRAGNTWIKDLNPIGIQRQISRPFLLPGENYSNVISSEASERFLTVAANQYEYCVTWWVSR